MLTLYAETDQVIQIPDVTDREGAAQTDATVEVTLYRSGTAIGGATDLNATHTGAGNYEASVGDEVALTPGERRITATVAITLADGTTKTTLEEKVQVVRRTES